MAETEGRFRIPGSREDQAYLAAEELRWRGDHMGALQAYRELVGGLRPHQVTNTNILELGGFYVRAGWEHPYFYEYAEKCASVVLEGKQQKPKADREDLERDQRLGAYKLRASARAAMGKPAAAEGDLIHALNIVTKSGKTAQAQAMRAQLEATLGELKYAGHGWSAVEERFASQLPSVRILEARADSANTGVMIIDDREVTKDGMLVPALSEADTLVIPPLAPVAESDGHNVFDPEITAEQNLGSIMLKPQIEGAVG